MTRKRPVVQLTLSDDARERLDEMATRCGETRSGMVERLIREAGMLRSTRGHRMLSPGNKIGIGHFFA